MLLIIFIIIFVLYTAMDIVIINSFICSPFKFVLKINSNCVIIIIVNTRMSSGALIIIIIEGLSAIRMSPNSPFPGGFYI